VSHHVLNGTMDVRLPGTAKWVLCVVAHCAVQSTRTAEITAAELARICGLSRSCVREQLTSLTDGGWISVERLPKAVLRIRVQEI
jgi:response regulator of citrate/malate metabolism